VSNSEALPQAGKAASTWYRAVWRWHFYAGLFCIPFVIWLSVTGTLYLWRPQIEAWLDRPYDHLVGDGPVASPEAQVAVALKAVPGATLAKYVLPEAPDRATRILVSDHGLMVRVYVDPRALTVLKVATEEQRPMRLIFHLHGELLAGAIGSYLVEIASCWAIVMIITGLYLWWPRGDLRFAGVVYPRLRSGSRIFWRDIHACAGLWVSVFALGLILTGLPWAKGWGSYLSEIRQLTGTSRGPIDWTIGGVAPRQDAMAGEHAGHMGAHMMHDASQSAVMPGELDRVVAAAGPLGIAPPVMIAPPKREGASWSITSDAADRPLRSDVKIDGATGAILNKTEFAQRHWIDQVVGYGVAVHEGALFGLANQILGTLTTFFLILLSVSGAIMWWRRRPIGLLGAPLPQGHARFGLGLFVLIAALAIYMPLFGISLLMMLGAERMVLRRVPKISHWLGLSQRTMSV